MVGQVLIIVLDRCKNEHPLTGSGAPANSRNPFNALQESPSKQKQEQYKLDRTNISVDLGKERPLWNLSCFGPGRNAPSQLFGGAPREVSFEELRLRHYELAASGNQQQAIQEAQALLNEAEQQNATALKDIDGAIRYIIDGENRHPNRHDVCKARGADPTKLQALSSSTTSFSQPSPFGGQPQAPTSAFGRPPTSAFSQPSSLGPPNPSFGQPTSLGQPSAFARPTSQPNATFGQPSNPGSAFGRSPFAATPSTTVINQPTNPFQSAQPQPFGQPPSSSPRNPFGQPAAQAAPNPFGQPVPQAQNVFSRDSAPQSAPQPTNPFGQPPNPSPYSFAQPTPQPTNVFGTPSAPLSAFSQQNKSPVASSTQPSNPAPSNVFTKPNAPTAQMATPSNVPSQTPSNARRDANGKLLSWKGQPVNYIGELPCYKHPSGSWERIWFPDGPPVFVKPESLPDVQYDEGTIQNYLQLRQTGKFKENIIPALPPKREWLSWDL
ncbi:hypothetical protein MMC31_000431 [Peltigera leucophlebia]|nr:hypothetical protein [Peltigera leucophlebia]